MAMLATLRSIKPCVIPLLFVMITPLSAEKKILHPPLKGELGITGTLGEYRWSRLHHGIDISTGGKIGVPVYAVDRGRVLHFGYKRYGIGYHISLEHPDGRISRYGHLSGFAEKILRCGCIKNDLDQIKFREEFFLEPDETIEFQSGELLAYSGDSGAGFAHLHFEYIEDDQLLDPLQYGLVVRDDTAPVLSYVDLVPANRHARINGQKKTIRLDLELSSSKSEKGIAMGSYRISKQKKLLIFGSVLARVAYYDPSGKSRLGLAFGKLVLNKMRSFQIDLSRLPLDPPLKSAYLFDLKDTRIGRKTIYNQYFANRTQKNLSVISSERDGMIRFEDGEKTIDVLLEVKDAAGNFSNVEFKLYADPAVYPEDKEFFPNAFPEKTVILSSKDRKFSMEVGEDSLLEPMSFHISKDRTRLPIPKGLVQISSVYTIDPDIMDFASPYTVRMAGQTLKDRSIYFFPHGGRYLVPLALGGSGKSYLEASARNTGSFVILSDRRAPDWRRIRKSEYNKDDFRLFIYPYDIGGGIDWDSLEVFVDGKRMKTEHDRDRRGAEIFYPTHYKKVGRHVLKATVRDQAGNRSKKFTYVYRVK